MKKNIYLLVSLFVFSTLECLAGGPRPVHAKPCVVVVCSGPVTLGTTAGGENYKWAPSTGLSCTSCQNPTATPTVTTTYTLIALDSALHKDTSFVTVDISNGADDIFTVAGSQKIVSGFGDGGPALAAEINGPTRMAFDKNGNLYFADEGDAVVRKIDVNGIITTVAGIDGNPGYGGDGGPATAATIYSPVGIVVDTINDLFITDSYNNVVRRVDGATGIITTYAGTGTPSFSGDGGPATAATMYSPYGLAMDKLGNLYIADVGNNRIRKITHSTGVISTIAGTFNAGFTGDGGPATAAELNQPTNVFIDPVGNLMISDSYNNRIRMVNTSGVINTIVGSGSGPGYSGDGGPATSAELNAPRAITFDMNGNMYIADYGNNLIRKVYPNGLIFTFAGMPTAGYSGDGGPAISAMLNSPIGVTFNSSGDLFISDNANNVLREVPNCGPSPVVTISGSPLTFCQGDSVKLTASATGPGPTAYSWAPAIGLNATSGTIVYAKPPPGKTTYTVTATNSSGTGSDTITIQVNPLPNDTITLSTSSICTLTGHDTLKANPAFSYTWSTTGGSLSTTTGSLVVLNAFSASGTYTVSVTATNTFGCTVTKKVTVQVNPTPTLSITPTNTLICRGSSVKLTATSSASSLAWSPTIGLSSTTSSTPMASPTSTTTYIVTGTLSGCSAKDSVTVKVDYVKLSPSTSPENCFGDTTNGAASVIVDTGGGAYSYLWSPGGATTSGISGLSVGTYTVKVTDKNSCFADMVDSVTQPLAIANSFSSTNVSCFGGSGGSIALTTTGGTSPYSYSWSSGVSSTSASAFGLYAGTYTITIKDKNGCIDTTSITITQPPKLIVKTTAIYTACYASSNGGAAVTVTGGTPGYTYNWSPLGGTDSTASGIPGGTYTVTVTDNSGCSVQDTLTVPQDSKIRDSAISTTLISCYGGNNGAITMGVKGGSAPYTYAWTNSSSSTISTTYSASGLSTGTYIFIVKDNHGCSDTSTVFFAQPSQLTATSVVMTICPGDSATLNANALGGTKPYTYSWNPTSATSPTINVTPTSNTSYVVTVTDSNNCKASGTDSVKFYPPIITGVSSPPSACSGSNVTIFTSSSGGNGGFTYAWYQGSGIISTGNSVIVAPTTTTSYTLITKDACGDTTAKTVTITPKPVPSVTVCCDSTIIVGQSVQLIASSSLTNIFAWMPAAGLSCVNCNTPKATPDITTTYTVTVTDSADGCFVVDTVTITIGTNNIVFYSGITPNGDGKNDTWVIDNINLYPNNTVSIFNRWGTEVWTANNYNNTTVVWDGHDSKGQLLPDATYYYVAKIGNNTYKGWVQLTR